MTDVRNLGQYSRDQKLRDICSLAMVAAQPLLWLKYGTLWSLVVPVVLFGTLACYFTTKDAALFAVIWKNHSRGTLQGLATITLIFAVASFYMLGFKYWFAVIIIMDILYVYWLTMLGWFVRERLT